MRGVVTDTWLDEIAEFVIKNGDGLYSRLDWDTIKDFARKHIDYRTIIVVRDDEGILSLCRWNMWDKETCFVCDLIVKKGLAYKQVIKKILSLGTKMYPDAKYIIWERLKKYPNRKKKKYLISDILKRRI